MYGWDKIFQLIFIENVIGKTNINIFILLLPGIFGLLIKTYKFYQFETNIKKNRVIELKHLGYKY